MLLHLFGASVTTNWNYLENNLLCCDVHTTEEKCALILGEKFSLSVICHLFAELAESLAFTLG